MSKSDAWRITVGFYGTDRTISFGDNYEWPEADQAEFRYGGSTWCASNLFAYPSVSDEDKAWLREFSGQNSDEVCICGLLDPELTKAERINRRK